MLKAKLLTITLLLTAAVAAAQAQLPDQKEALKGIRPLTVKAQKIDPDAQRDGLDARQIVTDVELRLRHSGVAIDIPRQGPSFPLLYVRVDTQRRDDRYNFSISLQLMTIVDLDSTKPKPADMYINRAATASIWQTGGFGVLSPQNLEKEIRSFIADQVDQFINDYLASNPNRATASATPSPEPTIDISAGYVREDQDFPIASPTPTPKVQLQKRALPDMPAERLTWKEGASFADSFYSEGVQIRLIKNKGLVIATTCYDYESYLACEITVLNRSDKRVDVVPNDFFLAGQLSNGTVSYVFSMPPKKLADKYVSRAKWGNFFRAFAAGMATTTTQSSQRGDITINDNTGNSASGTYTGTTTTTSPNRTAQRNAAIANERASEAAQAKSSSIMLDALFANTVYPNESVSGLVYFERKKFNGVFLNMIIDGTAYSFGFTGHK